MHKLGKYSRKQGRDATVFYKFITTVNTTQGGNKEKPNETLFIHQNKLISEVRIS